MKNCNLIIDSCCDLPANIIEGEDLTLVRFPYTVGNATYEDDMFQSISAAEFYGSMRKGAEPTTSQLTVPMLTETFEAAAKAGVPTVYLSFSSGLSGSFDVAQMVRDSILEKYPDFELHLVDTRLASTSEGLLIYEAINQYRKGLTAKELADWAEEARNFVQTIFMVEDLDSLHRGGRIPASVAVVGGALDVKPLLSWNLDGTLKVIGVARGRKKGIKQMVEFYQKRVSGDSYGMLINIGNADCPKDVAKLEEALLKVDDDLMFLETNIGPVIGSHVGPGMMSLVFWGIDNRESLSIADKIARRVRKEDQ